MSPNARRQKGFGFEREVVNLALEAGIPAKRAWGSDGRNLGHAKEVDLEMGWIGRFFFRVSCKFRKEILNQYLRAPEGVDIMVVKENRGTPLVLIPLTDFLRMLKQLEKGEEGERHGSGKSGDTRPVSQHPQEVSDDQRDGTFGG